MQTSPLNDAERCQTCQGEGVTANEFGPHDCPDCCGLGRLPSSSVLRERRLREIERAHATGDERGQAVHWLVAEVRKANHVLLQIMAAAMESREADPVNARVRYLANKALGLYPIDED